ncbi:MAG: T9SS type A sorting domain-containing protein [Bacteroidia bacterium]
MKKYIFVIIAALFINKAESQNWQWAISCGKSNGDDFGRLAIDNNSNLYLAGIFYPFNGIFGNDTFPTNGGTDIVFAKLNSSGGFQWVQQIYGNGIEGIGAPVFSSTNNGFFLYGAFDDSITLGTTGLASGGAYDIYLALYDLSGNCQWAKKAGGTGTDAIYRVASDNNGNLYAIGYVTDTAYFDSYAVPKGYYLAKYNSSGNCQWGKKILSETGITSISCYNNEVIVSGGVTNDTIIIDTDTLYSNNPCCDLLLAKFDSNGNLTWAKLDGGGTVYLETFSKYDNSGNIYVACNISGTDTSTFGSTIFLPTGAGSETALIKYDNNGNVIWAKETLSSNDCRVQDLSVNNGDGSCYMTGRFKDTITMDAYTVNTIASGNVDIFLARYNANGDCQGIRNTQVDVDGPSPGGGYSVVQEPNSTCYVAGQFRNAATFDTYTITSVWQKDIFIAKIDAIIGVGEGKFAENNTLLIYANPNAGKCNITVPDDFLHEKKLTLSIYDNTGRLIQQKTLEMSGGKIKLNLEAEAKGVYNVTLSNGKKSYNGKIVFE